MLKMYMPKVNETVGEKNNRARLVAGQPIKLDDEFVKQHCADKVEEYTAPVKEDEGPSENVNKAISDFHSKIVELTANVDALSKELVMVSAIAEALNVSDSFKDFKELTGKQENQGG